MRDAGCGMRDVSWLKVGMNRLGAFGVSFGLPILLYIFTFGCNDISGCPTPSLLHPSTLNLDTLKREVGWPASGFAGLVSWRVTGWTLAYYLFSAVLYRVLPGAEGEGVMLANGGRLKYKFNSEWRTGHQPRYAQAERPANQ